MNGNYTSFKNGWRSKKKKKPKFNKKTLKNQNFKKKKVKKMANYGIKRPLTPFMLFAQDHR